MALNQGEQREEITYFPDIPTLQEGEVGGGEVSEVHN